MGFAQETVLPLAKRFVAGKERKDALKHVHKLNADGVKGLIDILGEHVTEEAQAKQAVDAYRELIQVIDTENLDADVSLKLTHIGLKIDATDCRNHLASLLDEAEEHDCFIWIDMESAAHTEETLELFEDLHEIYDNLGVTLQSKLERSTDDLEALPDNAAVRLVKGAYKESSDIAYTAQTAIDAHYEALLEYAFKQQNYFAIATHDESLIQYAQELEEEHDRDRDSFEFQSLMGVRDGRERELAAEGYTVGEYVPYGPEWFAYYKRRMIERKNLLLQKMPHH